MIAPLRIVLCAFAALVLIAGQATPAAAQPAPAAAQPMPKPRPAASDKAKITTDTKVYLLRGLLNIFSLGMDALSDKFNAMGISPRCSITTAGRRSGRGSSTTTRPANRARWC